MLTSGPLGQNACFRDQHSLQGPKTVNVDLLDLLKSSYASHCKEYKNVLHLLHLPPSSPPWSRGAKAILAQKASLVACLLHSNPAHSCPLLPSHACSCPLLPAHAHSCLLLPTPTYSCPVKCMLIPSHTFSWLLIPTDVCKYPLSWLQVCYVGKLSTQMSWSQKITYLKTPIALEILSVALTIVVMISHLLQIVAQKILTYTQDLKLTMVV